MSIKDSMKAERRTHGCDSCHKDESTELFLGFNGSVLWICGNCYYEMSNNIFRRHLNHQVLETKEIYNTNELFKKARKKRDAKKRSNHEKPR